tara:strand:+ start:890 stop:1099 length:210 start_codon:yes stop_codon:yes gene_type:complete
MNFKFDDKDYDSDKLSDKGKLQLNKLQALQIKKNDLVSQFSDLQVLEKHYTELLKNELPKEDKKEEVKK